MMELLQQQYELAKSTRSIVFGFLADQAGEDLDTPVVWTIQ
ncbi:MAG TPA: hypothetical protein VK518_14215 [Puia sp.]|nr:hypothetical protein [Puia sp.]